MNALLIDIGNSRVKGRVIDTRSERSLDLEVIPLDRIARLAEAWRLDGAVTVDTAFISNVAGDAGVAVVRWLRETLPAVRVATVVSSSREAGVVNGYREPARLGPDRWMALIGARALMPDRSLLVCGFGTATTLDLLRHDDDGGAATFVGGLIVPGIDAMRTALVSRTVHLGVTAGALVDFADNTEDGIESGVMSAQTGAVREAWTHACRRTNGRLECVFAGGASRAAIDALEGSGLVIHHVPDLVLRGLAIVAAIRPRGADPSDHHRLASVGAG